MLNFKPHRKKAAALLLSAVMLFSSVHFTPPASAGTEWVQESVDKLTSWGVITRSDSSAQNLNAQITRAEFTAMINRAYGYTDTAETPFTDVPAYAWYADDISIGYNAGYFSGTTETTATPNGNLTREQAITLLARNMRLEPTTGEVTQFSDGRAFSNWSKGYIKSAVDRGIVNGFDDGSFRPQTNITRAEMIKLLADSLGTLINTTGTHTLGGVYGNVTINTPGTTLRNTTIAGDLYLTGGIGLGSVTLENVNVLGRIIVAGGGESEGGDASIVLRNVTAQSMTVDSLSGQYVSVSVQNDTLIPTTTVKTSAYIEDNSRDGMGLLNVTLDGDVQLDEDGNAEQMRFTLAGNVKTAVNKTPNSLLTIGTGTVQDLTISEEATGSRVVIDADGKVDRLNLDVGIPVTGDGDIGTLTVSAAGASTSMLPDEIIIRPGITATIAGVVMDSKTAEESSSSPRLLAGYPKANDIAPTSVLSVFSGNKSGTVYYAITPEVYGPVTDAEILVNPPTYGPTYTARGQINLAASNTEASVRVTGLTVDGTYYLSAVLVDSRGDRSTVKNVMFTTPDNTVPAFATGYPYLSSITETDAQLTAMTTKTCLMYYAIFPRGSAAPTANNFLSNSLEGSVVSGVFGMTKNTPITEWTARDLLGDADDPSLRVDYDMYLWLLDFDGGLSSAVRKLEFTTADLTPPEFITLPYVTNEQATSVTLTGSLNENGTVYWVAVAEGDLYPKAPLDPNTDTGAHAVTVIGGMGGGTYEPGDLVTIIPETTTTNIFRRWAIDPSSLRVTELAPDDDETSTFVTGTSTFVMPDQAVTATAYFVAPEDETNDDAQVFRGQTITTGSGVSLHSDYAKLQVANGLNGLRSGRVNVTAMTDFTFTVTGLEAQKRYDVYYVAMDTSGNYSDPVRMVQINTLDNAAPTATQEFTRFPDGQTINTTTPYANTDIRIVFSEDVKASSSSKSFLELYNDVLAARNNPQELQVAQDTLSSVLASTIELYTVTNGSSLPTLVTSSSTIDYRTAIVQKEDDKLVILFSSDNDTLNLKSGSTYFFRLKDITDTSTAQNRMGQTDLPRFTTVAGEIFLQSVNELQLTGVTYKQGDVDYTDDNAGKTKEADIVFSLTPRSTSTMEDDIDWNMLIWLGVAADFELYAREQVVNGTWSEWRKVGDYAGTPNSSNSYAGITIEDLKDDATGAFPQLNATLLENHVYQYGIHFTKIGVWDSRASWSVDATIRVNILAGSSVELTSLVVPSNMDSLVASGALLDIGTPKPFTAHHQFTDQLPPSLVGSYPQFEVGDTSAVPSIMLDRTGTVYWLIAPVGSIRAVNANTGADLRYAEVPEEGGGGYPPEVSVPSYRQIISPRENGITSDRIQFGSFTGGTSETAWTVTGLESDTEYFAFFVLQGTGETYSQVLTYGFKTEPVTVPHYTLSYNTSSSVNITETDNRRNLLYYKLISLTAINSFGGSVGNGILQRKITIGNTTDTMTVLDALTTFDVSGLSYFDLYADNDLKLAMAQAIRSSTSGDQNILGGGSTTLQGGASTIVDCTQWGNMSEGVQYLFLTVGQTAIGNSATSDIDIASSAFRALYPIYLTDSEAPQVVSTRPSFTTSGSESSLRFSGTCTVTFNETIYKYVSPTSPPLNIDQAPTKLDPSSDSSLPSTRPSDDGFVSIESLILNMDSPFISIELDSSHYKQPTASFQIKFQNMSLNQSAGITFSTDFSDVVPNRRTQALEITLTPQVTGYDIDGNRIYGINVSVTPAWDARTST